MSDPPKHSSHTHHAHTQKIHTAHNAPAPSPVKSGVKRGTGFWLAATCYLVLLCCAGSWVHSILFWLLILGVIPALTGLMTGNLQRAATSRQSFAAGLRAAGGPVFFFSVAGIMMVHYRVYGSDSSGGAFLVALFAGAVYALLAGLVSGLISMVASRQAAKSGGSQ